MKKLVEHTFSQDVWRWVPSSTPEAYWVAELRSPVDKTVEYYAFRPHQKPVKLHTPSGWWSGIETVQGRWVVFHGFAQPDLPLHQGLTVWDAEKDRLAWKDDFLCCESAREGCLMAKIPSSNGHTLCFGLSSGTECEPMPVLETIAVDHTPTLFLSDHPHFASIVHFVQTQVQRAPLQLVEYLETENQLFISYFTAKGKIWSNHLLIVDNLGTLLLDETLAHDLKGITRGTFHVSNGLLSFVKEKKQVVVYQL